MRAMIIEGFGGPEALHLAELAIPEPGPGDVRVKVVACSVNPADWKTREGMLSKYIVYHFPFVLGFDVAGVVDAVGDDNSRFAPGDRVFGISRQGDGINGSYAEFTLCHEAMLAPLPEGLSFEEAATLPVAGMTALGGLVDVGKIAPGQTVLINGGAGGVGSIAIQIAKAAGAQILATCSAHNADYVRGLGADAVIDYRNKDVVAEVKALCPGGVDLVLDAVGLNTLLPRVTELVRRGGAFVEIETLISQASQAETDRAGQAGIAILSNMIASPQMPDQLARIATMAGEGRIKASVTATFALEEVAQAHRQIRDGHTRGKIAIRVDPAIEG